MIGFDYPYFTLDGQRFEPKVFDAGPGERAPEGFNAIRIPLDGTLLADLNWTRSMADAAKARDKGLKMMWDLDLGLFTRLPLPVQDDMQFRALSLALSHLLVHIRDGFLNHTLGVVLYRGSLDFKVTRPVAVDYLRQLTVAWPDVIQPMLLLDATSVRSPLDVLLLSQREGLDRFALAIKGSALPGNTLGWERGAPHGFVARRLYPADALPTVKVGVCLPSTALTTPQDLEQALVSLTTRQIPFRAIAEEYLTAEWDGLDYLLVPQQLGASGRRKLLGFCAAGGTVLTLGESFSLPQESSFVEWELASTRRHGDA